jgi:hypothetical protein
MNTYFAGATEKGIILYGIPLRMVGGKAVSETRISFTPVLWCVSD